MFGGKIVCFSGIASATEEPLSVLVTHFGGEIHEIVTESTHFLVTGMVGSDAYSLAARFGVFIVTVEWIQSMIDDMQKIERNENGEKDLLLPRVKQELVRPTCTVPCFLGLEFCSTQMEARERKELSHAVQSHGGAFVGDLTCGKTTHLIAIRPEGVKFAYAIRWGIRVVSKEFVTECIRENKFLNPKDFALFPDSSSEEEKDGKDVNEKTKTNTKNTMGKSLKDGDVEISHTYASTRPGNDLTEDREFPRLIQRSSKKVHTLQHSRPSSDFLEDERSGLVDGDCSGDEGDGDDNDDALLLAGIRVRLMGFPSKIDASSLPKSLSSEPKIVRTLATEDEASQACTLMGATSLGKRRGSRRVTHFVVQRPLLNGEEEEEILRAMKQTSSLVVDHRWLLECLAKGEYVKEDEYLISSLKELSDLRSKAAIVSNPSHSSRSRAVTRSTSSTSHQDNFIALCPILLKDDVERLQDYGRKTKANGLRIRFVTLPTDMSTSSIANSAFKYVIVPHGFHDDNLSNFMISECRSVDFMIDVMEKGTFDVPEKPFHNPVFRERELPSRSLWRFIFGHRNSLKRDVKATSQRRKYGPHEFATLADAHTLRQQDQDISEMKPLEFCLTGFAAQENGEDVHGWACTVIESLGGYVASRMHKRSVDILVCMEPKGEKFLKSFEWSIPAVGAAYLEECVNHSFFVDPTPFLLHKEDLIVESKSSDVMVAEEGEKKEEKKKTKQGKDGQKKVPHFDTKDVLLQLQSPGMSQIQESAKKPKDGEGGGDCDGSRVDEEDGIVVVGVSNDGDGDIVVDGETLNEHGVHVENGVKERQKRLRMEEESVPLVFGTEEEEEEYGGCLGHEVDDSHSLVGKDVVVTYRYDSKPQKILSHIVGRHASDRRLLSRAKSALNSMGVELLGLLDDDDGDLMDHIPNATHVLADQASTQDPFMWASLMHNVPIVNSEFIHQSLKNREIVSMDKFVWTPVIHPSYTLPSRQTFQSVVGILLFDSSVDADISTTKIFLNLIEAGGGEVIGDETDAIDQLQQQRLTSPKRTFVVFYNTDSWNLVGRRLSSALIKEFRRLGKSAARKKRPLLMAPQDCMEEFVLGPRDGWIKCAHSPEEINNLLDTADDLRAKRRTEKSSAHTQKRRKK